MRVFVHRIVCLRILLLQSGAGEGGRPGDVKRDWTLVPWGRVSFGPSRALCRRTMAAHCRGLHVGLVITRRLGL